MKAIFKIIMSTVLCSIGIGCNVPVFPSAPVTTIKPDTVKSIVIQLNKESEIPLGTYTLVSVGCYVPDELNNKFKNRDIKGKLLVSSTSIKSYWSNDTLNKTKETLIHDSSEVVDDVTFNLSTYTVSYSYTIDGQYMDMIKVTSFIGHNVYYYREYKKD